MAPAADIEHVLAWIAQSGDLAELDAFSVERFAWYELPTKWSEDHAGQRRTLRHLSEALAAVGRNRLAARCTDAETCDVLAAWQQSHAVGMAAFRKAADRSPCTPPEVVPDAAMPGLVWGSVMGIHEAMAHATIGHVLGDAWEAGVLTPGSRGWRQVQQRLAGEVLTRLGAEDLTGATVLDGIFAERLGDWARRTRSAAATSLLTAAGKLLLHRVGVPEEADHALAPLRLLLAAAEEGIALTANHTLNLALVRDLASRFDWGLEGFTARGEGDEPLGMTVARSTTAMSAGRLGGCTGAAPSTASCRSTTPG